MPKTKQSREAQRALIDDRSTALMDVNDLKLRLQILRNSVTFGQELNRVQAREVLLEQIDGLAAFCGLTLLRVPVKKGGAR